MAPFCDMGFEIWNKANLWSLRQHPSATSHTLKGGLQRRDRIMRMKKGGTTYVRNRVGVDGICYMPLFFCIAMSIYPVIYSHNACMDGLQLCAALKEVEVLLRKHLLLGRTDAGEAPIPVKLKLFCNPWHSGT